MRIFLIVLTFSISFSIHAKEWKSLKQYQNSTNNKELSSSDWLTSDRTKNTFVWQRANAYNLLNNLPQEYQTIKERRDFYVWIDHEFKTKGHEVIWQRMAHYISCKLRLLEVFPYVLFISAPVKGHVKQGSELIFNFAFKELKALYNSNEILKGQAAMRWDENMLHDEQFIWIEAIYSTIDQKSLNQIKNMAEGKFLYALVVPKAIRFKGDISNPQDRYIYALNIFKPYCETYVK